MRGLKRDRDNIAGRDQIQHRMLSLLKPPLTMQTVEDGLVVLGTTRREFEEHDTTPVAGPHFYGSDVYCLRHARFYDWEEMIHVFARALRIDCQPMLYQGPAIRDAFAALWGERTYAAKKKLHLIGSATTGFEKVAALRVRSTAEGRWRGARMVCVITREEMKAWVGP